MMAAERHTVRLAVYLILRKDNEVLMMRRQGSGYFDGWYGLPSGHVEADEMPTAALTREIAEEIGVTVDLNDVTLVHTIFRDLSDCDYIDLFFTCTKWQGAPRIGEPHKCDDMQWFPINALPEKTIDYIRSVLQDIEKAERYSEFPSTNT